LSVRFGRVRAVDWIFGEQLGPFSVIGRRVFGRMRSIKHALEFDSAGSDVAGALLAGLTRKQIQDVLGLMIKTGVGRAPGHLAADDAVEYFVERPPQLGA
jgi:hypothetical protein